MPLARHANTRDTNEAEIVQALVAVGAMVERMDTPVDLLVGYRGVNHLIEIKLPLGPRGGGSHSKLGDEQRVFFQTWRGSVKLVRDVDAALIAIGARR